MVYLPVNIQGSNELNKDLLRLINEDGRIHMVPSEAKDVYFLRFAICSAQMESSDVEHSWSVIKDVAGRVG